MANHHRTFTEFAAMLEHDATTGPDEGPSEAFYPECQNPLCGESMDEEQSTDCEAYTCLNCRCEFVCEIIGGSPAYRITAEPI